MKKFCILFVIFCVILCITSCIESHSYNVSYAIEGDSIEHTIKVNSYSNDINDVVRVFINNTEIDNVPTNIYTLNLLGSQKTLLTSDRPITIICVKENK